MVAGLIAYWAIVDFPKTATFLNDEERAWVMYVSLTCRAILELTCEELVGSSTTMPDQSARPRGSRGSAYLSLTACRELLPLCCAACEGLELTQRAGISSRHSRAGRCGSPQFTTFLLLHRSTRSACSFLPSSTALASTRGVRPLQFLGRHLADPFISLAAQVQLLTIPVYVFACAWVLVSAIL